jgi:hypothetical protein
MEFDLVEPAIVQDVFCYGIEPEDLGNGNLRYTAFSRQRIFHGRQETFEYITVGKLVVPVPVNLLLMRATARILGMCACGALGRKLVH